MKKEELQIGQIVDIKYKGITFGDCTRWLNNMKVLEIGQTQIYKTCRGEVTSMQIKFEQQSKKPRIYYIELEDIYYIRKH